MGPGIDEQPGPDEELDEDGAGDELCGREQGGRGPVAGVGRQWGEREIEREVAGRAPRVVVGQGGRLAQLHFTPPLPEMNIEQVSEDKLGGTFPGRPLTLATSQG